MQEGDDEVDQNWTAVCEWTAKKMLKSLEDSEVLKVCTRELKGQVLSPDESSLYTVRNARQARSEKSKKLFQIFSQGANEVLIASMARREEHLTGLVVMERHCLALREEEVEHNRRKTESFGYSDGGQDEHAEGSRTLSEADLPGVKKSWRSRR